MSQNYQNPFNPSTVIRYDLPVDSYVVLQIYDALGRLVATPVQGEVAAGYREARWDASAVASGLYLYGISAVSKEVVSRTFNQVRKMLVLK